MHADPEGVTPRSVRRRARAEEGSFLVEVVVTAALVLTVGMGMFLAFDGATRISGEQRTIALAAQVAQTEQERLRALPLDQLTNLDATREVTSDGRSFDVHSQSRWVTHAAAGGELDCSLPDSGANYVKATTTVSWANRTRRPVVLETLIAPSAALFGPDQGALAVLITDRDGMGVPGVAVALSGGRSMGEVTNDRGCALFGGLPTSASYAVRFSRSGSIDVHGASEVSQADLRVTAGQVRTLPFQIDQGGTADVVFTTKRPSAPARERSAQPHMTFFHAAAARLFRDLPAIAAGTYRTPLLFPHRGAYAVYADTCARAAPPEPVAITVPRGGQVGVGAPVEVRVPALEARPTLGPAPLKARIRVSTACGTAYARSTDLAGRIDDPGFPYGTLDVCVSFDPLENALTGQVLRRRVTGVPNTDLANGRTLRVDFAAPAGPVPGGGTSGPTEVGAC
jgi:hypothetical protein